MSKSMADKSSILINGAIFSTLKHTEPHTVRGRSTQKASVCNEHLFRNGSFHELRIACPRLSVSENDRKSERATATGELKIAKESNDLADLAKVLPESYPKSNETSVNRNVDRMLLQTTEEHSLIKTRCVVFKL